MSTGAPRKLVLAPLPQPAWGGLHAVIASVAPHLAPLGFELVPVVPQTSGTAERFGELGVKAITLDQTRPRRTLNLVSHARFVAQIFRDRATLADLAAARGAALIQLAGLQNIPAAMAARRAGVPIVWQIHSTLLPKRARRVLTPVARAWSASIMVNGNQVRAAFPGLSRYPDDRIVIFRAPIDVARFRFTPDEGAVARGKLGIGLNEIVVGTIGNQTRQKAHDRLVALADRMKDVADVRFVILGGVVTSNAEEYRRTVIDPADSLDLLDSKRLQIVDAGNRVRDYLPAFDLFVMPSRAEGIPVALLEAMAARLPAVVSDVGSMRDAVRDRENGFVVGASPFDEATFERRVRELVADPALRAQMGERSRARAEQDFAAETVAEAHATAYRIALER